MFGQVHIITKRLGDQDKTWHVHGNARGVNKCTSTNHNTTYKGGNRASNDYYIRSIATKQQLDADDNYNIQRLAKLEIIIGRFRL